MKVRNFLRLFQKRYKLLDCFVSRASRRNTGRDLR